MLFNAAVRSGFRSVYGSLTRLPLVLSRKLVGRLVSLPYIQLKTAQVSSDLHDFGFFVRKQFADFVDVLVGQFLNFVYAAALVVF